MAGTSRVNGNVYARFCGRLVVKFHRPTRQPYEARASRTVLRETRGANPRVYLPDLLVRAASAIDDWKRFPSGAAITRAKPKRAKIALTIFDGRGIMATFKELKAQMAASEERAAAQAAQYEEVLADIRGWSAVPSSGPRYRKS